MKQHNVAAAKLKSTNKNLELGRSARDRKKCNLFQIRLMCAAHSHLSRAKEERKAKQTISLASCSVTTNAYSVLHTLFTTMPLYHSYGVWVHRRQHFKRKLTYTPANQATTKRIRVFLCTQSRLSNGATTMRWQKKINNFFYIRIHLSALEVYLSLELDVFIVWKRNWQKTTEKMSDEAKGGRKK